MLLDHIERIRRKPPEVRRRYAFMVSIVFTGLIALVWLVTLVARFDTDRFGFGQQGEQGATSERPGLMDELREAFSAPEMRFSDDFVQPATSTEPEGLDVFGEEGQEMQETDLEPYSATEDVEVSEPSPVEEAQDRGDEGTLEEGESLVPLPTQR